jgi:Ca2+-binding RTX toxin-like protein
MSGGAGNDLLKAHGGGDGVQGNGGNDKLGGGAQFDHLNGGAGKNVCSPGPDGAKLVKCKRGKV